MMRVRTSTLLMILVVFGLGFGKATTYSKPTAFSIVPTVDLVPAEPWMKSQFVSTGITRMVHAPSVLEVDDGNLLAFWFAGSREGARDVEIHRAMFNSEEHLWTRESSAITRSSVQTDLNRYIRKLGNPVAVRDRYRKIWLFFVSASIGGWSTSSVNLTTSMDNGNTWSPARRLITSPFLNLSTLVKTAPFFYRDGTMGLPVYHEFFDKFGEILDLDAAGNVIAKKRLNGKWRTLQPLVLLESADHALALMRYSGPQSPRRAIQVETEDAGRHWSEPRRSRLPNPDAAMAGTVSEKGRMILVINNNPVERDDLTLMVSEDAGNVWKPAFQFEDEREQREARLTHAEYAEDLKRLILKTDPALAIGDSRVEAVCGVMCGDGICRFRFDYPYLIRSRNGNYHLLYTWNRTFIKHVEFNQAWLEERIRDTRA